MYCSKPHEVPATYKRRSGGRPSLDEQGKSKQRNTSLKLPCNVDRQANTQPLLPICEEPEGGQNNNSNAQVSSVPISTITMHILQYLKT